jgi:hypothetical protein
MCAQNLTKAIHPSEGMAYTLLLNAEAMSTKKSNDIGKARTRFLGFKGADEDI